MVTMTLSVPEKLKHKMETHPEINWSEVARQAFKQKIEDLEFLRKFKSKSTLTEEEAIKFAALIKDNITSELLLKREFHLFAPEFIFEEFEKYRDYLKKKSERTEDDFDHLLEVFKRNTFLVVKEEIKPFIEKAKTITPDIGDVPYLAIALKLQIPIWSNDKDLKEKQSEIVIYSTSDLMRLV
jgi:predicted nucleic acid-binding protein